MKIAFWSGVRGLGGVTGNLAAISTVCAYYCDSRIVLSSNHLSNHMIEDCFFEDSIYQPEGRQRPYCFCYGETAYFRALWELQKRKGKMKSLEDSRLTFEPPLDLQDATLFREEQTDYFYMMDVSGKNNAASKQALEEADAVVVFLTQKQEETEQFFQKYASLIPKSIFLINNYRKWLECTPSYISRKYRIDRQRISVIPRNDEYAQACELGKAESFVREHLFCEPKNKNFEFVTHIKIAAEMIILLQRGEI